jgi:hypothetical protein
MSLYIVEFNLKSRSPVTVENGDVIVDKGYLTVTVRNVQAESRDDSKKNAIPMANAFLNELCHQYSINLELSHGCKIMLQQSSDTRHINTYNLSVKITGGQRKRIPRLLKEVKIQPSDAKSYYRKAQITTDHFDKFRNFYFVIENVGSRIAKHKKGTRLHDIDLINLTMRECFSSNLKILEDHCHLQGLSGQSITTDLVSEFLFYIHRCQLNHSKDYENKKIPFNPDDEWEVQSSLPLAEFVAKSLISYEDNHLLK